MLGERGDHAVLSGDSEARSRDALLRAAIGVVERAQTSAVTFAEIASAAGVDADEASALFPSVDDLLVEATLHMCREDLRLAAMAEAAPTVSAYAHHFASRRPFYRAMRVSAVAAKLDARMAEVIGPRIAVQIRTLLGSRIDDVRLGAMTAEVTAESFVVTNRWIADSPDGEGAESLYVLFEAIVLRRLEEMRTRGA